MKKYVTYCRVSTKKQGDSGISLEGQLKTCLDYIESVGGELLQSFHDIESGSSRKRKGLNEALELAKKEDAIIVFAKLDRLSRDTEYAYQIKNSDIGLYFCDFPEINSLFFGILVMVAEYERELSIKRTRDAISVIKQNIKENGYHTSRATGEPITKLGNPNINDVQQMAAEAAGEAHRERKESDETWQNARKLALENRGRGDNYRQIVNTLNSVGMKTRTGGKWGLSSVKRLIDG